MPAVIDTGVPRVLHSVDRADCPISGSQPINSIYRSSRRSYPVPVQPARFPADAAQHRCTGNVASSGAGALLRTSWCIDEPDEIPGNHERDKFLFADERSAGTCKTTSSKDSDEPGRLIGRNERRERDRRRRGNRRERLGHREIHRPEYHRLEYSTNGQHVPEIDAPQADTTARFWPVDETHCPGSSTKFEEPDQRSAPTCRLTQDFSYRGINSEGPEDESSNIVIRLFGGCYENHPNGGTYRRIEKSSTAISSQGLSRDADYEWKCECFTSISSGLLSMKATSCDRENLATPTNPRERRKSHSLARFQRKSRSYVQTALFLILVALGHGSYYKTNYGTFGGKSGGGGIGAGFGALTIGTIVGAVRAFPIDVDAGIRAERSANLSHITGASRKIQMYIKNRHLQILKDGTVNGSNDDTSDYTIFQRTSVSRGQLRIQGVATCLYLCMDSCGLLYGSREYTEECVFNETLEQHNYNTYSSVRWSTPKKSLYLGLNRHGQPRRVQAKGHNLGRLSAYARVLTQVAPPDRVEALQARMLGAQHNLRHHHNSHHHRNMEGRQQNLCPTLPPQEKDGRDWFRCRKRKKRKKWRRRCNEGEKPGPHCEGVVSPVRVGGGSAGKPSESTGEPPQSKRSCEGAASEELCRKQALDAPAKKRKSRIEPRGPSTGPRDRAKKKKELTRARKVEDAHGAEDEKDQPRRKVSGAPNGKRKKPPNESSKQSSSTIRKKVAGRATRTTIASSKIQGVTPPSFWLGSTSTTPSTEAWDHKTAKAFAYQPQNFVTSSTSKEMNDDRRVSRKGKSQEDAIVPAESSRLEITVDAGSAEDQLEALSSPSDWSAETSEEIKSDDDDPLSISLDDETTNTSPGEFSTLMTTMDTTSPERTEDYTRATTESIIRTLDFVGSNPTADGIMRDGDRRKLDDRELPSSYGRFAM